MTIIQAITRADDLQPNDYGVPEKVRWLSELDHKIYEEIIKTHEGADVEGFAGYDEQTPQNTTQLLAADAYAELYISWLCAKIDFANAEVGKYNNEIMQFNSLYGAFERWYNRTHMPLGKTMRYY